MTMPTDIGVIDLMIATPFRAGYADVRVPAQEPARPRVARRVRVPGAVHVQERAAPGGGRRSGPVPARADGPVRHREGHARRVVRRGPERRLAAGAEGAPRPLLREPRGRPEPRHGPGPRPAARGRGARREGGDRVPRGPVPAGPDQRREVLPDLREVHRARHPDLRVRGRARAAGAVRAPVRRPHRRGVLVLPRAEVRHPPRLRAVGRPRGEAAAEVAEPLLLDLRVRAPLLPGGHRQVREHPRRRQGDVRGLLPDGPVARPHLQGDARRAVPRPRLAKFLRENAERVFKL